MFLILEFSQYVGLSDGFSFFQGVYVRIDIKNDIFISIRPMTTKFGNRVHLEDSTQMKLINQMLETSSRQDHRTY